MALEIVIKTESRQCIVTNIKSSMLFEMIRMKWVWVCVSVRWYEGPPTDVFLRFSFSFIDNSLAFTRAPIPVQFFLQHQILPHGFSRVHLPGRNRFDFLFFYSVIYFFSLVFCLRFLALTFSVCWSSYSCFIATVTATATLISFIPFHSIFFCFHKIPIHNIRIVYDTVVEEWEKGNLRAFIPSEKVTSKRWDLLAVTSYDENVMISLPCR